MVIVKHVFRDRLFVLMSKTHAPVVLFYSGVYTSTSLSDVHLTTFTVYVVYRRHPHFRAFLRRTKETGEFPRRQTITFEVFGRHYAESAYVVWTYGRRATEMELSLGFDVLTAGLRARRTIFIFLESDLEKLPTHHGDFRCHKEPWLSAPSLKERLVFWRDGLK